MGPHLPICLLVRCLFTACASNDDQDINKRCHKYRSCTVVYNRNIGELCQFVMGTKSLFIEPNIVIMSGKKVKERQYIV